MISSAHHGGMLRPLLLTALLTIAFAPQPAGADATSQCEVSGETRICGFSCDWEPSAVSVAGAISAWFNQWRVIEVRGYCGDTLSAFCRNRGDCEGYGTGNAGNGACQVFVGSGVDAWAACSASSAGGAAYVAIEIVGGLAHGSFCEAGVCQPLEVVCATLDDDTACGVGRTKVQILLDLVGPVVDSVLG